MDIYKPSSIRTSSRLTLAEEEELRKSRGSTDLPDVDAKDELKRTKTEGKVQERISGAREDVSLKAIADTAQRIASDVKRQLEDRQPRELLQPPGRIHIAVAENKGQTKGKRKGRGGDGSSGEKQQLQQLQDDDSEDTQYQIQASAMMNNEEFETIAWQDSSSSTKQANTTGMAVSASSGSSVTISATSPTSALIPTSVKQMNTTSTSSNEKANVKLESLKPHLAAPKSESHGADLAPRATPTGAALVLSASPTLTSSSSANPGDILTEVEQYSLHKLQSQKNTSSIALSASSPPVTDPSADCLDPEHFRVVFRELSKYTEQLEHLNDQILEAMTLYQPQGGEADGGDEGGTCLLPLPPSSPEESRKRLKGKEKANDLDKDRFCIAQLFTDLVMDSWPRIYKIPLEPKTAQMTKRRIKMATRLKNAIVAFWGAQTHFQDRAQLVLDVYQDPKELEQDNKIRILKSRHLNNLLGQGPLDPQEIQFLIQMYELHQDKMSALSEQLQNVWLGILLLLGDPEQIQSSKFNRRLELNSIRLHGHTAGAPSSSSSYYLAQDSPPLTNQRSFFDLGRKLRLGFKVTALLAVGSGMIAMALAINMK
ncbi:hypothetical protein EDD11_009922 [Mortierella claussenii]|nr:hypothetical protein EDD11_009922 [Mortierella claussenii]